jgi:hypothetical protein
MEGKNALARLSIWNSSRRSKDFQYIDRNIREFFSIGGTEVRAHLYLGPYLQATPGVTTSGATVPAFDPDNAAQTTGGIMSIEDPILMENRDRKYSPNPVELRGIYNVNDLEFDLRQFGLFLQNDTLYIEFHLGAMIERCGRKLMPGDVLELPHRRDTGLDPDKQIAVNKFYLIDDASRASDGYSATWWPHIWRTKVTPMPAGQEFADILNAPLKNPLGLPIQPPATLSSVATTAGADLALNTAIDDQAKIDVPKRYFETRHYYMHLPEGEGTSDHPWIFAGDGVPPNGATLLGSGNKFPPAPNLNEYYLRTDYQPETLFMWTGNAWRIQEQNFRTDWSAATDLLRSFVNEDGVSTMTDGSTVPTKVNLSRAVLPRADF